MSSFHLDYETRSRIDLTEVGAYKYAEDPSTEIFCAAIALEEEEPVIWINPKFEIHDDFFNITSDVRAFELMGMLEQGHEVYAHNAQFEHAITKYVGSQHGIYISDEAWRCTAAMSRRAAIPSSLEKAAETLGLKQQKDAKGKALIRKFSMPNPKTGRFLEPQEDPAAFKQFIEYCLQDVRVEQQIHRELKNFGLTGQVLKSFQVDLAINSRGLSVNMDALRHAQVLIETEEARLTSLFQEITGFNPTQREVALAWLQERGYDGDNMQAATIEAFMEREDFDPASELGIVMEIRKKLGYASIKKVKSMLACACNDGRVRGTLQFYGASTGRWSGRLIQPQNFKRPTIKHTDVAYSMLCKGESAPWIETWFGPQLEVISSCIRHFIQPQEGFFFDVDYSAIEARIVCWLAGQDDALEEYVRGVDRYKRMASVIYHILVSEVNDFPQRFVGKQATLGCGFQMSGPKFRGTCANYGYILPYYVLDGEKNRVLETTDAHEAGEKLMELKNASDKKARLSGLEFVAVKAFRSTHDKVVKFWYAVERAVKRAIRSPGEKIHVGRVMIFCAHTAGAKYLFIKLPSGRRLAYRDPIIVRRPVPPKDDEDLDEEEQEKKEEKFRDCITFWGNIKDNLWGRVDTYGGCLVENITQAVAADVMSNGAILAEAAGFEIATLVHDQCLVYGTDPERLPELEKCLTTLPSWGEGLPIAVEGKITPYYKK